MIYLTTTLPPHTTNEFMTIMRIKADDVSMFPAAVFDEYHTVLDSSADFRSKMCQFGELIERGVQTIYLAATLPPHTITEFNS